MQRLEDILEKDLRYIFETAGDFTRETKLKVIVYNGGYEDTPQKGGAWHSYLGENFVCICAPKCGRTLCGSVSKVNPQAIVNQDIDAVACLTGKYIATRRVQLDNNAGNEEGVSIRVESVPLPIPERVWGWVTIDMGA